MKKIKPLLLFAALAIWFGASITGCAPAAPQNDYDGVKEEIRTTLQSELDKGGTSVSYAVMQNGALLIADAVGYLDGTEQAPATTETLYNIGSVSKVYCAAAVMKLVDEGKIKLDDPVVSHLPDFKMEDERYKNITVRMLLNHASGIPGTSYTTGLSYGQYDAEIYEKVYHSMEQSRLKADPGAFSVYCNDGFMLAEMLVAEVSGMGYAAFVEKNILGPIDAASSGFADRDFAPDSYAVEGTRPHEFPNVMGSGGISTNIADLCKFGQIFLNRGQGILSEESSAEMSSYQGETFIAGDSYAPVYGLGWDSVDNGFAPYDFGGGVLAKSGGTGQFSSQLYVMPQYDMVCAISATADFAGSAASVLGDIAAAVLRVQGVDVAKPAQTTAAVEHQPLPTNFSAEYAGIYGAYSGIMRVTANEDGTIATALFNGTDFSVNDAKLYFDGAVFVNESGEKTYAFLEAEGRKYIMGIKENLGLESAMAQKLEALSVPSTAWKARLGKPYLPAYVAPDAAQIVSGLILYENAMLPGILIAGQGGMFQPLGIQSDQATEMILRIPGSQGRDLYTLRTKTVNGEEWLYNEYYDLRPAEKLEVLKGGALAIPQNGDNRLYKIPRGTPAFTIPEGGRVIAYDSAATSVYDSITDGAADVDKLPKEGYIRFLGHPGDSFMVTVQ